MSDRLRIDKFDDAPPEIREVYHRLREDDEASRAYFRSHEFIQFAKRWEWWFWFVSRDHSLMVVDLGIVS